MLSKDNFTKENIVRLQNKYHADPSIITRVVFAFGLLEALCKVNMEFIFKGGTAISLLLNNIKRFSTDIDIIVTPDINVDEYISKAGIIFPFINVEEDFRTSKKNIVKRHFKFKFISPLDNKEINILLDVLFDNNPYSKTINIPIKNNILLSEEPYYYVTCPNIDCILGDKLTAFAPHTTGIPFGINKELEIIKQFYDCYTLIMEMDNYDDVFNSYINVAKNEILFRNKNIEIKEILSDTINCCLYLIDKGKTNKDEYNKLLQGINAIQGHIIGDKINGETAPIMACYILLLSTCVLNNINYKECLNNKLDESIIQTLHKKTYNYIKYENENAYLTLIKALYLLNGKQ